MSQRTSHGHLVSMRTRFKRTTKIVDLRAYLRSEEFVASMIAMTPDDRAQGILAAAAALRGFPSIPATSSVRVKTWDDAMIERLKKAARQYDNDADIARALRIPVSAAKRARWKYVGPKMPKAPPCSQGVAATPT